MALVRSDAPLGPADVDLLQRVFDIARDRLNLRLGSEEAEALAPRLLGLFQSGVHTENELLAITAAEEK
ncbi:hypothetical protein [Sinorhizobium medicae]